MRAVPAGSALVREAIELDFVLDPFRRRVSPLAIGVASGASASPAQVVKVVTELVDYTWFLGHHHPGLVAALSAVFAAGNCDWVITPQSPAARADALEQLESLLGPLLAEQASAEKRGEHDRVWWIAEVIQGVCARRGLLTQWQRAAEGGVRAAWACGDFGAQAWMRISLGTALLRHGPQARHARAARGHGRAAARAARAVGDGHAVAAARELMATASWNLGHRRVAWRHLHTAAALDRRLPDLHGLASRTVRLAGFAVAANPVAAALNLNEARVLGAALGDDEAVASAYLELAIGAIRHPHTSTFDTGHRWAQDAVGKLRPLGSPHGTAQALAWSAVSARQHGLPIQERQWRQEALDLAPEGTPDHREVLGILAQRGPRPRAANRDQDRDDRARLRGAGRPVTPGIREGVAMRVPRPTGELWQRLLEGGVDAATFSEHLRVRRPLPPLSVRALRRRRARTSAEEAR
ncbi:MULTISPECIES: hypothetical protein [unclassified Crossiella]|uniref:hypothetical protein n=1 Tax=unclassified Crossiella TaxID=2620835 RepID=UPI001FFE7F39|nr:MULTISPECIES: hypothetical protein [unclassified Crossiella]MCK2240949.1 hypothetical protein [Crossiella sp. S99.2]MCK2253907.1 hypothetical protein [Crossiella sp. S99.1]